MATHEILRDRVSILSLPVFAFPHALENIVSSFPDYNKETLKIECGRPKISLFPMSGWQRSPPCPLPFYQYKVNMEN
jgi:hypothetical protein